MAIKSSGSATKERKIKEVKAVESFEKGQKVVVPIHGVGVIEDIIDLYGTKCFKIRFANNLLHMPVDRFLSSGVRDVISEKIAKQILGLLKKSLKVNKGSWSKRSQEYEAKIYSGDIYMIANVVRELHNNEKTSYSENNISILAMSKLAEELACAFNVDISESYARISSSLKFGKTPDTSVSDKMSDFEDIDLI